MSVAPITLESPKLFMASLKRESTPKMANQSCTAALHPSLPESCVAGWGPRRCFLFPDKRFCFCCFCVGECTCWVRGLSISASFTHSKDDQHRWLGSISCVCRCHLQGAWCLMVRCYSALMLRLNWHSLIYIPGRAGCTASYIVVLGTQGGRESTTWAQRASRGVGKKRNTGKGTWEAC